MTDEQFVQVAPGVETGFEGESFGGDEDVGEVASVEVGFFGLEDDGFGVGELLSDEVACGARRARFGFGGVDLGETDATLGPSAKAEIDVEIECVAVDNALDARQVAVGEGSGARENARFDRAAVELIGADGVAELGNCPLLFGDTLLVEGALGFLFERRQQLVVHPSEAIARRFFVSAMERHASL